jgi:hypothetical protein
LCDLHLMGASNSNGRNPLLNCCASPSSTRDRRIYTRTTPNSASSNRLLETCAQQCCGCDNSTLVLTSDGQAHSTAAPRRRISTGEAVQNFKQQPFMQTTDNNISVKQANQASAAPQDIGVETRTPSKEIRGKRELEIIQAGGRSTLWSGEAQPLLGWTEKKQLVIQDVIRKIPGVSSDDHYQRQVRTPPNPNTPQNTLPLQSYRDLSRFGRRALTRIRPGRSPSASSSRQEARSRAAPWRTASSATSTSGRTASPTSGPPPAGPRAPSSPRPAAAPPPRPRTSPGPRTPPMPPRGEAAKDADGQPGAGRRCGPPGNRRPWTA